MNISQYFKDICIFKAKKGQVRKLTCPFITIFNIKNHDHSL
jgi:hypothetical protein